MRSTCIILFAVSGGWNPVTCTWSKFYPEVLYKGGDLINFSKFTDKHKKLPYRAILSKDVPKNLRNSQEIIFAGVFFFNKVAGWKPGTVTSSQWNVLQKSLFLKWRTALKISKCRSFWIIHKILWQKSVLDCLFDKVAVLRNCNFIKKYSDTGVFQ